MKCSLKRSDCQQSDTDLNLQKRNYHETPENKKQEVNRRYDDKRESAKQYKKDTMWKIKYCI